MYLMLTKLTLGVKRDIAGCAVILACSFNIIQ